MNPISRWFERKRLDNEMADEIAEHLAEKVEQLCSEGHTEAEARALALKQFGNVTLQLEDGRAAWGWTPFEQFCQDIRFGCRVLLKTKAFTVTAIAALALGIGHEHRHVQRGKNCSPERSTLS